MKANELEEFSAKELDRLSREREEAIKAKGGLPYLGSLPVGESKLILQAKIPTDNPDRDGRPRKDPSESKRRPRKYCVGLPPRLITGDALASKLGKGSRMQFVVKKAEDGEDF